jgi:hypothetical protein
MGSVLKYLVLLIAAVIAFKVFERLREGYGSGFDATELTGEECATVELNATVDPTRQGEDWDRDSPPDIIFQVGSKWTAVCHDTLVCQQNLELPVPAKRIELKVWDRDEKDQISGDEVKTELIGGGWMAIDRPQGKLGFAHVSAKCLD